MSAIGCRIGWHHWNMWAWVPAVHVGPNFRDETWKGGQFRKCLNCGMAQSRAFEGWLYRVEEKPGTAQTGARDE